MVSPRPAAPAPAVAKALSSLPLETVALFPADVLEPQLPITSVPSAPTAPGESMPRDTPVGRIATAVPRGQVASIAPNSTPNAVLGDAVMPADPASEPMREDVPDTDPAITSGDVAAVLVPSSPQTLPLVSGVAAAQSASDAPTVTEPTVPAAPAIRTRATAELSPPRVISARRQSAAAPLDDLPAGPQPLIAASVTTPARPPQDAGKAASVLASWLPDRDPLAPRPPAPIVEMPHPVAPLPADSSDTASTGAEALRGPVITPIAVAAPRPERVAAPALLPRPVAVAVNAQFRNHALPRDAADAAQLPLPSPGDVAPRLAPIKDAAPMAVTPREPVLPVAADPIAGMTVVTDRFGDVRIAVEGTATDLKVALSLMAMPGTADVQRLANGLAADLAASGVRLQSLDISGGDTARGGASTGQREPGPQRPPPPPVPAPTPARPPSDRYA